MKSNSLKLLAIGGVIVAILVLLLVFMLSLSDPESHVVYPRQHGEALIDLGRLPTKKLDISFGFPPLPEAEVIVLRKNVTASIVPEEAGWVVVREHGDIYPDGENHSYSMFEVYTEKFQHHYLKLQFQNPDRWPEKLIVTVSHTAL